MVKFTLNGQEITSPQGWETARVNAIFAERSQPDISVEEFTFEKDAIVIIDAWISKNGLFRGCPFTITLDGVDLYFFLDFTKFVKVHAGKYIVGIKKARGLNLLSDRISGYTFGLLAERQAAKGTPLTYYDIPYIVDKKYNALELSIMSVTIYLIYKALRDTEKDIEKLYIDTQVAIANGPFSVGDWIGVTLKFLLMVASMVAQIILLKNLMEEVINAVYPIRRKHKGFKIKDHLASFISDIGFNGIEFGFDVEDLYYFPSKEEDFKSTGIPNPRDYGYSLSEMVEFVKLSFNADFSIDSKGVVQVRSANDPYFEKNSTYVLPDILQESVVYNNADLKGTKIISFQTDITDEWTIDNYTGTSYEVHTKSITEEGEALIKGYEQVRLNVALANRKDTFTFLEKRVKEMAQAADSVINLLGGNSTFGSKIKKRLGFIKVSAESWNLPKVMRLLPNLTLATDYRSNWSAKYLWDEFHIFNSYVANNFINQKRLFSDVEMSICPNEFNDLLENSYFLSIDGSGKFTKLQKSLDSTKSVGDYWIREIYDRNLKEEYIEP